MPNWPIEVRSPALPLWPTPQMPRTSGSVKGRPSCRSSSPAGCELEAQLGRPGVLGVLDQLEDEVGPLAVQLAEQVQHRGVPAVAGDVLVADLLVVGWHRRS